MRTLTPTTVLCAALTFGSHVASAERNSCQQSSHAALQSCRSGAQSDYLLALGQCDSFTDPSAFESCQQQALSTRKEDLATCTAEFSARQQICSELGGKAWDPVIDPTNFTTNIDNPYYPLKPGTTFVYQAKTDQGLLTNFVAVTPNTKVIMGVTCVEVHDTVQVNGQTMEDTLDWFAQDKAGNVWYFGEDSEDLTEGRVSSLAGSWKAGENNAKPGIVMEARPAVGDAYRQEFLLGTAEDFASVLNLDERVTGPLGTFNHCLKTKETSGLEPDTLEFKFYAPGVGLVFVDDVSGGLKEPLVKIINE